MVNWRPWTAGEDIAEPSDREQHALGRSVKRRIAVFLVVALSACATRNMPGTIDYIPVPESQFIEPRFAAHEISQDKANVIVKRDAGFMGSAISSVLLLDGKRIARIKPGQYIKLSLLSGEHLFGVEWTDKMGALETRSTRELAVDCRPGKTYYMRMFPQPMSGIAIERSSE